MLSGMRTTNFGCAVRTRIFAARSPMAAMFGSMIRARNGFMRSCTATPSG